MLARLYLTSGRADRALEVALPAVVLHAEDVGLLETIGTAQMSLGRFDEAAVRFKEIARLHPYLATPRYHAAEALLAQDKKEEARRELQAALEADPAHHPSRLTLARLLLVSDGPAPARVELEKLRAALPDDAKVADLEGTILPRGTFVMLGPLVPPFPALCVPMPGRRVGPTDRQGPDRPGSTDLTRLDGLDTRRQGFDRRAP